MSLGLRSVAAAVFASTVTLAAHAEQWRCWYEPTGDPVIVCRLVRPANAAPADAGAAPLWNASSTGGFGAPDDRLFIPLFEHVEPNQMPGVMVLAREVLCERRIECGVRFIDPPIVTAGN